ncbi:hypothetical protein FHL15_002509 [Xylaria flabelliformis]|uniref:RING-type domain-containing protein n=1 Tax=Xylaria flabelliformis TaxID=2512241 RepID=A0A553I8T7_9PEZI|nr:hypothetical protein FHL15_002509 [Xylaria flabelliformis]
MDWTKVDDDDDDDVQMYNSNGVGLPSNGSSGLEMGNYPYPEVIDLDPDSPVQVNFQHDEISCKNDVLVVFPDICPDYLAQLTVQHRYQPDTIVSVILDAQEKTGSYPTKTHTESNPLKRKRDSKSNGPAHNLDHASDDDDNDDDSKSGDECDPECVRSIRRQIAAQGYSAVMRSTEYNALARTLLSQEFPRVPQSFIRASLRPKDSASQKSIFEIYTEIDEQIRNGDNGSKPWQEKKSSTKANPDYTPGRLQTLDMSKYKAREQAAFAEFAAARKLRATKDARIAAEAEEHQNFLRAKNEGQTTDCGICFEECPLNRMVRRKNSRIHLLILMGKYALTCMSMDGCSAGFSRSQRALFLNKKLTIALDRIEQEAVLRMAGIENLETCPICPYAAEYPPVEIDKEFRCENPTCLRVSCRLCRKETHIPKTCAEVDADRGLDARHALEEAMSEALIRRCNLCKNAFVKIDGCNKVRCTKCGTLQCDVCRQTIKDYTHFDDTKRGGKLGQCPLYDQSQGRYEKEVSKAEAEVRKKIVSENPELDEKTLSIPTPDKVYQDTSKREAVFPTFPQPLPVHPGAAFGRDRHAGAARPRLEDVVRPIDLQIHNDNLLGRARYIDPVFPGDRIATAPNPALRPHGITNRANAVHGATREAQRTVTRKEPPATSHRASLGHSNATQTPAPRPLSFGAIMDRVENITKLKFGDARRPGVEVRHPNVVPQLDPFLTMPPPGPFQQHVAQIRQTQTRIPDPTQFQMGIHFPPFAVASGAVNGEGSSVDLTDPMIPLPPDWDFLTREQ